MGSNSEISTSKSSIFWDWFSSKSNEIFKISMGDNALFSSLHQNLKDVHPDLCFEIGPEEENGCREFIISAGGIYKAFPAVKQLVNAAPEYSNWKIVAFKPRKEGVTKIEIAGLELDAEQIHFDIDIQKDNKLSLFIYIPNYDKDPFVQQGVFILLDSLIGEYDVETKIGFIDFYELTDKSKNLYKLSELAMITDEYYKKVG